MLKIFSLCIMVTLTGCQTTDTINGGVNLAKDKTVVLMVEAKRILDLKKEHLINRWKADMQSSQQRIDALIEAWNESKTSG